MSKSKSPSGICQICGCTQEDCTNCIERTGSPCSWTDQTETMCSACQSYINSLDQLGQISEKIGELVSRFIVESQISKLEYDNKLSVWKVYYAWDLDGSRTDTFVSAEDLLLFLYADQNGI